MGGFVSPLYESRRDALNEKLRADELFNMGIRDLLDVQYALGAGGSWGKWEFPPEFMPDGQLRGLSRRSCSIEQITSDSVVDELKISQAWTEIIRYGIVRSIMPGARVIAKPSTIMSELHLLIRLAKKIVEQPYSSTMFWSKAASRELSNMSSIGNSIVDTLRRFKERGYISDCLREEPQVEGRALERNRYNEAVPDQKCQKSEAWLPLPDRFTSECGWRSIRIIRLLGPTLLSALEEAMQVSVRKRQDGGDLHPRNQQLAIAEARDAVISGWSWLSKDGSPIESLEFDLLVKETKNRDMVLSEKLPYLTWPPKTFADAWGLLSVLQGAHLFPICLASGPRASEVCGFTVNCLKEVSGIGHRIVAKTYKLVNDFGGRQRDFCAPELVVDALQQQIRLAQLVKQRAGLRGDHLWVHTRTFGRGLMGEKHLLLSRFIDDYASKINVRKFLDNSSRVHVHRYRKTLARIVALSLVNSPIILMDCFGHEDLDMTIRSYILSDEGIAREVLKVQKELVILMAVDVINDSENLGGAVGEQLRNRKSNFLQLLGKSEFEPQDAYEFAARETFDGRSWIMVSPGVYCTLPTGSGGLCAKGQGRTNPAYCQSGCPFQLLTAAHQEKCDDAVAEIIMNLQKAIDDEEDMVVSLWAGQLKNWLHRWPQVEKKWRSHPLVEAYGQIQINK